MRLTVLLATFDRVELLRRTLATILAQRTSFEWEILIVLDGCADATRDYLSMLNEPRLRFILQEHAGQAAALNRGIQEARGEVILFLDDDMLCAPDLLSLHAHAHDRAEAPVVVVGKTLIAAESRSLAACARARRVGEALARLERRHVGPYAAGHGNSSVPRQALLDCGGFDLAFAGAREDAELGARLWKAGLGFRYEPRAEVREIYGKSGAALEREAYLYGRNEVRLCRRHPEWLPYSPLLRFSQGPLWKRLARRAALRAPSAASAILLGVARVAESSDRLRRAGEEAHTALLGLRYFEGASLEGLES